MNTANKLEAFSFNYYMYKQTDDVAMGSPLSVALANIFVGYHKSKLFESSDKPFLCHRHADDHRSSQGRAHGARSPQLKCHSNKNVTKKAIVFSVSVSFIIFCVQYTRTTVISNIYPGGHGPLNLIFTKQFKFIITRAKLRVFVLKIAASGPHLTFA